MLTGRVFLVCVALAGLLLIGCHRERDRVELVVREDLGEALVVERSHAVVTGRVVGVEDRHGAGRAVFAESSPGGCVTPILVRVEVEHDLTGRGLTGILEIPAWRECGSAGREFERALGGVRMTHYLRKLAEGRWGYTVDIPSSMARTADGPQPGAERSRLTDLLFEGACAAGRVGQLERLSGRAFVMGGYWRVARRLRELTGCGVAEVRREACELLSREVYLGPELCGAGTAGDDEWKRGRAKRRRLFLADPRREAAQFAVLPGEEGVEDILRLVAEHPDAELARAARSVK